jgi:hypothetical protein
MGISTLLLAFNILFFSFISAAFAGQTFNPLTGKMDKCLTIKDASGSPADTTCGDILVTTGSLINNGNGTYSLNIPTTSTGGGWTRTTGIVTTTVTTDNVGVATATPTSRLTINGSFAQALTNSAAATYTLTDSDNVLLVDSTAGVRTRTLPTAVGITGRQYVIKDWKGTAGVYNITVTTTSSQTIDGATSYVINSSYGAVIVESDGANWSVIDKL